MTASPGAPPDHNPAPDADKGQGWRRQQQALPFLRFLELLRFVGLTAGWGFLCLLLVPQAGLAVEPVPAVAATTKPLRILHVTSFDSVGRWTTEQFEGFRTALGPDLKAEFRVVELDTLRRSAVPEQQERARQARQLIESWRPDLVYATDDEAQDLVTRYYYNAAVPFVFSGLNKSPAQHGLTGAHNITGVLEQEHFAESVRLFKALVPGARRFQVLCDMAPLWTPTIERISRAAQTLDNVQIVAIDRIDSYAEFQKHVLENTNQSDAYIFLGISTFKDERGANVRLQEVQQWLASHSRVPEISFWSERVYYGALTGVTVSAREQGLAAGKLARAILVEGRNPASLPVVASKKGTPAINLARARALGIMPRSRELLTSEVATDFEWDKK